jgi:hypothetical protein
MQAFSWLREEGQTEIRSRSAKIIHHQIGKEAKGKKEKGKRKKKEKKCHSWG